MGNSTTLGRLLVNRVVPKDMRDPERVFDKKDANVFFQDLAEEHPDEYVDVLRRLSDISRMVATEYGDTASLRLRDLKLPPRTKQYRNELRSRIHGIAQDPGLTSEQKNDKIVATMRKAMPTIQKTLETEVFSRDNAYGDSIKHGFRGSPVQLTQLLFGDMLVADHKGRPIPIPGLHGYGEGVTGPEYWAGAYGARKGYSDVQFATAKTGFLGKQLSAMSQNIRVTGKDCGAKGVGTLVTGDDPEIIGSVLAKETKGLPAGTAITKKHLSALRGAQPLIRSLDTCQQKEGVCQLCAGKRDQNKFPTEGSYIGVDAARVISEPMTQELGLSAKHVGGVIGLNSDNISGFDEVNQFVQVPKAFQGAAVLAPVEGRVRSIKKAPQGGHYLYVEDQELYVPPERKIEVSPGDSVEAGDTVTDGTPHPAEIAGYKGLGEGRQYFQTKFYDILKKNGVPTHRRNVEVLSRAFFDKVRVTNPDGVLGYRIQDIIPYGELQREYSPRTGAEQLRPKRSTGMYLERPVMHYTIGTKVTPKVAAFLEKQGIDSVVAHKEHPGFEPYVVRAMGVPGADPDWKVGLSGFGLKKSFLEAARMGAGSKKESTSYVPSVMDPSRI